jgi:dTDP-4-amino-4,6-dideoxygalactose transaminase
LELDKTSKSHRQVFEGLRQQNIGVNVHYIPVHTQPYYAQMGFAVGNFPQAEKYYAEAISLPMYQDLSHAQQDQVVAALYQELTA